MRCGELLRELGTRENGAEYRYAEKAFDYF